MISSCMSFNCVLIVDDVCDSVLALIFSPLILERFPSLNNAKSSSSGLESFVASFEVLASSCFGLVVSCLAVVASSLDGLASGFGELSCESDVLTTGLMVIGMGFLVLVTKFGGCWVWLGFELVGIDVVGDGELEVLGLTVKSE